MKNTVMIENIKSTKPVSSCSLLLLRIYYWRSICLY